MDALILSFFNNFVWTMFIIITYEIIKSLKLFGGKKIKKSY